MYRRLVSIAAWGIGAGTAAFAQTAPDDARWTVAGRQGVLMHVIVPAEQARDPAAYARQVPLICETRETCFVNFYTNSTGAAATVPLPEAIAAEATAVLRRSAKQGAEGLRFSCRLGLPVDDCF